MNQLVLISAQVPALVRSASERAQTRSWGFFVANNRNPHTMRAPMAAHFAVMVALLLARAGAGRSRHPSP